MASSFGLETFYYSVFILGITNYPSCGELGNITLLESDSIIKFLFLFPYGLMGA